MKYATYNTNNYIAGFVDTPPQGNFVILEDNLWAELVQKQFGYQIQLVDFTKGQTITTANIKYIANKIIPVVNREQILCQQISALLIQVQMLQLQVAKLGQANG